MLGFGGRKKKIAVDDKLYAPLTGELIPLEQVADPVFAKKIMGDGFAIDPIGGEIVSPVAGEVVVKQGHAIGLRRADGLEVLLHLGLDTVSLNGAPFALNVEVGDIVEGGSKIGEADWEMVDQANLPRTTMILISNTADKLEKLSLNPSTNHLKSGDLVGQATSK